MSKREFLQIALINNPYYLILAVDSIESIEYCERGDRVILITKSGKEYNVDDPFRKLCALLDEIGIVYDRED